MKTAWRTAASLVTLSTLGACSDPAPSSPSARWYTADQVEQGAALFQTHCAVCHGVNAEGTTDWMTRGPDGNFPPPPLDGSAHAWHHPLRDLQNTIRTGGVPYGGVMPGFGETLSDEQILATIAYFQSKWPDEIYVDWNLDINKL